MKKLKWSLVFGVLAAVLAVGTALAFGSQADPARTKHKDTCSTAAIAGAWGYTVTGTLLPPTGAVPFAIVGRATFKADGTFTGTQISNAGGTVGGNEVTKGSFAVSSDCNGTFSVSILDQSGNVIRVADWATVHVENQTAARGILTSLVVNGTRVPAVLTITESKVFPAPGDKQ